MFLLCRVKQVKLAVPDRPAAASHTLRINLTHKLGPLSTPFARCLVALQMKDRHILHAAALQQRRKILFTTENIIHMENTIHYGNTVYPQQHFMHKQRFFTFKQAS